MEWDKHQKELWDLAEKFNDLTGYCPQMFLAKNLKNPCMYIEDEGTCYILAPDKNETWCVSETLSAENLLVSDEMYLIQGNLSFEDAMVTFLEKTNCGITFEELRADHSQSPVPE